MVRFTTAGESHGQGLVIILEGVPAGLSISEDYIGVHLARLQKGYGRGGRMLRGRGVTDQRREKGGARGDRKRRRRCRNGVDGARGQRFAGWTEEARPHGEPRRSAEIEHPRNR